MEVGVGFEVAAFPPVGALVPFANDAWLFGVMGVEGVDVAGGSGSDVVGALAVELLLFGFFFGSFLSFLLLGLALFGCRGVGGA